MDYADCAPHQPSEPGSKFSAGRRSNDLDFLVYLRRNIRPVPTSLWPCQWRSLSRFFHGFLVHHVASPGTPTVLICWLKVHLIAPFAGCVPPFKVWRPRLVSPNNVKAEPALDKRRRGMSHIRRPLQTKQTNF